MKAGIGPSLERGAVKLWVNPADHRVLKLSVTISPDPADLPDAYTPPPPEAYQRLVNYDTGVEFPATVRSMSYEEADRLSRMGEQTTEPLLLAVEEYFRRHGVYPATLDPASLAGVFSGAWPTNPFTNQPVRDSDEAGDYRYVVKNGGADYEYTMHGWHRGQLFFDSARIDVPYQPRGKPPP